MVVSPRKPASPDTLSARKPKRNMDIKSCDSLFSTSSRESASMIYQRKLSHNLPMARQPSLVNASIVQQRVVSARNLRMKTFQNQLADAQHEIASLAHENRLLRTLHKRHENSLAKYESANAELPRLLNSHNEEVRMWQAKFRNMQAQNKELETKLKQREGQILSLSDQNKHYNQLNKDKNLDERQRLQEKVRVLEQRLQEKDNDMKLMARKIQLESRNFKQQMLNEQKKTKEIMLKLEKAKLELSGYRKLEELTLGDKIPHNRRPKITVTEEEPGKIEKLEKSLETLEKAIEKSNQIEFNALTEGLDKDFDCSSDEKSDLSSARSQTDSKLVHTEMKLPRTDADASKLVRVDGDGKLGNGDVHTRLGMEVKLPRNSNKISLPPAQPMTRSKSKSILGQALANKLREKPLKTPASSVLRSGAGTTDSHDVDSLSRFSVDMKSTGKSCVPSNNSQIPKSLNLSTDFSASFEDYDEDFGDGDDEYEGQKSPDDPSDDDRLDLSDINRNDMSAYAAYIDTDDRDPDYGSAADVKENIDDVDDEEERDNDSVILNPKVCTVAMKEDISSIRKQISDDYKEREAFLDTFCRQASNISDPKAKKRNSIANTGSHITAGRKNQLLAALKAIDDNKSQD